MGKNEFITYVSEKNKDYTKKAVSEYLDAILDSIQEVVASGEKLSFVGFGSFDIAERAAREGRNPKDGSSLLIPASRSPKFKAGKMFKERLNV